jgi:hypothetical protein
MPVVVNEFEVVPGTPPNPTGASAPDQQQQPPPPDPTKAEEELERTLRRLHDRATRLHAS